MIEALDMPTPTSDTPAEPTRRVLMIAFYFPPDGGGGTQRTLKFCRYLPSFGWSPVHRSRRRRVLRRHH